MNAIVRVLDGPESITLLECDQRSLLRFCGSFQKRKHGRALRVQEYDGPVTGAYDRAWTYHCACEDSSDGGPRPCCYHSGAADVGDCYCEEGL